MKSCTGKVFLLELKLQKNAQQCGISVWNCAWPRRLYVHFSLLNYPRPAGSRVKLHKSNSLRSSKISANCESTIFEVNLQRNDWDQCNFFNSLFGFCDWLWGKSDFISTTLLFSLNKITTLSDYSFTVIRTLMGTSRIVSRHCWCCD